MGFFRKLPDSSCKDQALKALQTHSVLSRGYQTDGFHCDLRLIGFQGYHGAGEEETGLRHIKMQ